MAEVQTCPDASLLQRLLDGLLTEQEQAGLNEHLAECSACQERLDGLIAGQGLWSDVARNLKSAHAEIEAGTATRYAPRPGEALDQADDDLTLDFLDDSDRPESLGRLGHYEVLEVVGRGGMGIVLRAFDEKLHRVVAIKVMAPRLAATSPPRKRFLREARAAAQVRHENVVDIHAVEEQPIPHLVMEFVPGESLQQRLDRIGPLEVPDVLRIGQQIARGLAAAHAQGLIHRDVKPGNVLLEKGIDERVKITDFGLARAADDASMTQSGVIAGTPLYMAPEQAQGGAIDHRADLFSLGSVLYTMASGRPPFRAPTSLAVLKRVVEDAPRPIQEIIPEVPQWLCDIIARLHAKRPEDRFQSAKEVADLIGQCLAHGQPSAGANCGLQISDCRLEESKTVARSAVRNPQSAIGTRPWTVAACLVLLLLCVLSLSEVTGVTQVAATVIRLLTPEGTLVVETNDPNVKVTIEGDGGLVITGAGLEEIRLRPGSYKVRADKAGKSIRLDQELVTITRGDRQVVRVRLEGASPVSAAASPVERGAFVVLGGKGVAERKFDTLAEAVQNASDGDTIEIRGNGPFATEPIPIRDQALTIRAGHGFRPVIQHQPTVVENPLPLINTEAALVIEGLEFHFGQAARQLDVESNQMAVQSSGAPIHVSNCRFLTIFPCSPGSAIGIMASSSHCVVRNCQFAGGKAAINPGVKWRFGPYGRVLVENCLFTGTHGVTILNDGAEMRDVSVQLVHNTFLGAQPVGLILWHVPERFTGPADQADEPAIRVTAAANIFQSRWKRVLQLQTSVSLLPPAAEKVLPRLVSWNETRNLYVETGAILSVVARNKTDGAPVAAAAPLKSLAEWHEFWGLTDTGCLEGLPRYHQPDALPGSPAIGMLSPEDFRLLPESPGYQAGEDGQDLGADVDKVGPGLAYERWKQTTQYQEWLAETGQK